MKGINIDEANKLIMNPMQIDIDDRFKVEEAKTEAPAVQSFEYVEPVEFGTGCFGNPQAFNRLQEIIHQRENTVQQNVEEVTTQDAVETSNSLETNFTPFQEGDGGAEPAFC